MVKCWSNGGSCRQCNGKVIFGMNAIREAPFYLSPPPCGHCPFGGGVLTLARMVWGTFLEKNFPSSNGHLLDFGGV